MGLAPADVQAIAEGWRETLQAAFGSVREDRRRRRLLLADAAIPGRQLRLLAHHRARRRLVSDGVRPKGRPRAGRPRAGRPRADEFGKRHGTRGTADGNSSTGSTSVIRTSADAPIMLRFSQGGDGSHAPWFVQVRDTGSQEQGGTRTRTCTRALHQ
jgi:hypothetical protein